MSFFAVDASAEADRANKKTEEVTKAARALKIEQNKTQDALDDAREAVVLVPGSGAGRPRLPAGGTAFDSLTALTEAAKIRPDLRLRNEAIACLALPDVRPTTRRFGNELGHRNTAMVLSATDPNTHAVAEASSTMGEVIVRSAQGVVLHQLHHPQPVENVFWRMDGKLLAVGCRNTTVTIWRMPAGRRQSVLEGHQSGVWTMEFSPDGSTILTKSFDGTTRLWDPIDGRVLLRSVKADFSGPMQADGQLLFNGGRTLERADGRECRILHCGTIGRGGDHQGYLHGPFHCDFSPDGRVLAAPLGDVRDSPEAWSVRLWDVDSGREVGQLPGAYGMCFAANGDLWVGAKGAVVCWPLKRRTIPGIVQLGPPQRVELPAADALSGWDSLFTAGDRVPRLVVTDMIRGAAYLIDTDRKTFVRRFSHRAAHHAAISPDGACWY